MSIKKKKKVNVLIPEMAHETVNANTHLSKENLNDLFQRALRTESLGEIGRAHGITEKSIEKRIGRICRNALAVDNAKVYWLDSCGYTQLVSINKWAGKYIRWQMYKVDERRTSEEVAKLIGSPVKLVKAYIRGKRWAQEKEKLGAFE